MRIIGFSEPWPKLKEDTFTTFRFIRRDHDWEIGELAQAVLNPRSPKRQPLGIVRIIEKEPRMFRPLPPALTIRISPCPLFIRENEAITDGFASLAKMEAWLLKVHGRERVENEIINKLTLRWNQDLDVCECGDYRHQHENGVGKCRMPDDLCHGFKPCTKFRKFGTEVTNESNSQQSFAQ